MANDRRISGRTVYVVAIISTLVALAGAVVQFRQAAVPVGFERVETPAEVAIDRVHEVAVQSSEQTLSRTEVAFISAQLDEIRAALPEAFEKDKHADTKFYVRLGFSVILGGAALYVILSNKYDKETKKWAISVLTLISGVWVGSSTA
jgi:hypothetical protein